MSTSFDAERARATFLPPMMRGSPTTTCRLRSRRKP